MKNIKIYNLLICLCLMMQSCLFSEDDLFEDSSAQRASASVNECQELLQSAVNGWLLEYYPGYGPEFGGFNLIVKFDGKNADMASETNTASINSGEIYTSAYKVASYQGTELSFDSYNELIHSFCEPYSYIDPGYAGDYEFIFRSATKEKIVLTGKKHNNILVMTPLPEETEWGKFLTNINKIKTDVPYVTYTLNIGGHEIVNMLRSDRTLTIEEIDDEGRSIITSYPFIYTEDGIKMYEPMTFNGVSMTRFRWNEESESFVCIDEGVNAEIVYYIPEDYWKYIGTYIMRYGANARYVTIVEKIPGLSYTLSGLPEFDVEIKYNINNACLDFIYQYLGIWGSYQVYLCPWDSIGGYLTWAPGSGLMGVVASESPLSIRFVDNGVYGSANSLMFYAFTGAPSSATMAGYILQIPTPTLQKVD